MVKLRDRRASYAARLEDGLRRLIAQLRAMPEVRRISVFGSYARGRRDLATDLDVLVVLDTSEPMPERLARLYRQLDVGVDLDLVAWTPAEYARMCERSFGRTITAEERILYEVGPDR